MKPYGITITGKNIRWAVASCLCFSLSAWAGMYLFLALFGGN